MSGSSELAAGWVIVAAPEGNELSTTSAGGADETIDVELEDTDRKGLLRLNVTRLRR